MRCSRVHRVSPHLSWLDVSDWLLLFQMISQLPAKILKLLEFVGFTGNKVGDKPHSDNRRWSVSPIPIRMMS